MPDRRPGGRATDVEARDAVSSVGGKLDEPVELVAYDPSWPGRYADERRRLAPLQAAGMGVEIEHFGSTAVPGLAAKPVVDLLVGVDRVGEEVTSALTALGYEFFGEAGVPGRLCFRLRRAGAAFNVSVVERGGELWRDNLLLRDYLRSRPDEAREYAGVKRRAAASAPESLLRYSALKADAVAGLLERARREAAGGGGGGARQPGE